jgi:hypothetical protein
MEEPVASAVATLLVLLGGLAALDYAAARWGFDSRPTESGREGWRRWW